jgi:hypothetical protein
MIKFFTSFFIFFLASNSMLGQRAIVDQQFGLFANGNKGMIGASSFESNAQSAFSQLGFVSVVQSVLYQEMLKALAISPEISGTYCNDQSGSIRLQGTLSNSNIVYSWQGPNGFSSSDWSIEGLEAGSYVLTLQLLHIKLPLVFEVPDLTTSSELRICRVSAEPGSSAFQIWFNDHSIHEESVYQLFRSEDQSDNYDLIAELQAGSTSYLDTLTNNLSDSYRYRARLINECGVPSLPSEEHQPFFLKAFESKDRQEVTLSWSPYQGRRFTSQKIFKSTDEGVFEPLVVLDSIVNTFTDTSVDTAYHSYAYYLESEVTDCDHQVQGFTVLRSNTETIIAASLKDDDQDGVSNLYDECLNTSSGEPVDVNGCAIFSLPAETFVLKATAASCPGVANGSVSIEVLNQDYSYHWTIDGGIKTPLTNFKHTISNLRAGTYEICIYVDQVPNYKRCFSVTIKEPEKISASAQVWQDAKSWELTLSGALRYTIRHNDSIFETTKSKVLLPLKPGLNRVEVTTPLNCQGIFEKEVFLSEKAQLYPNPTKGPLSIFVPGNDSQILLRVVNMMGNTLIEHPVKVERHRVVQADLSRLPEGIYFIVIRGKTTSSTNKLIIR